MNSCKRQAGGGMGIGWLVLPAVLTLGGCSLFPDGNAARLTSNDRLARGKTYVLPGIEGKSHLNRNIRDGLADGGLPTAIQIYEWGLPAPLAVVNQMAESRARTKAAELAFEIKAYKRRYPGRPVYLVAHSGGCAVAIFTAEAMGRDSIDGVVLLAPSVSPEYDLTEALERVSGQVISYFSSKDAAFLGLGTFIFGNVGGGHSSAAGRVGFAMPLEASGGTRALYRRKLVQIAWNPSMELSGNYGGHTDWANRLFIREYVAGQLRKQMPGR